MRAADGGSSQGWGHSLEWSDEEGDDDDGKDLTAPTVHYVSVQLKTEFSTPFCALHERDYVADSCYLQLEPDEAPPPKGQLTVEQTKAFVKRFVNKYRATPTQASSDGNGVAKQLLRCERGVAEDSLCSKNPKSLRATVDDKHMSELEEWYATEGENLRSAGWKRALRCSGKGEVHGMIFYCNSATRDECLNPSGSRLFGNTQQYIHEVGQCRVGCNLFLIDKEARQCHAGFVASEPGQWEIDPTAWCGCTGGRGGAGSAADWFDSQKNQSPFPAQVRWKA